MKDNLNYTRLGKEIRALREDKGLTQEQLAARMDCSPLTIGRFENAVTRMSLGSFRTLCKTLRLTSDEIIQLIR